MKDFKYGLVGETKKERRSISATYSSDNVHNLYIAIIDRTTNDNKTGSTGVSLRADKMQTVNAEKYRECGTIGTSWVIVKITISDFFNQKSSDYTALFDSQGRLKMTKTAFNIIHGLIARGIAKIVHRGNDYVTDLWEYWVQCKNFGFAVEMFLCGTANHDTKDRDDTKTGIQVKTAFTLYRTERKPTSTIGKYYEVGTNCGTSTANGFR